jgi:long-chain acyl-CoA synthetase
MMAIGSSSFETVWTMADDTAAIIYAPRPDGLLYGAELTHLNLFFNACTLADRQLGLGSQDVALAAVPLFDVRGQTCVMNATLYAGGAVVLVRDVAAAPALQVITKQRVTYLVGDAPLYGALSQQAQSAQPGPSSLATCLSFGQPLPADVALALRERLGVSVLEGYGLAEASPVVTLNPRQAQRPGSVGLPMWGTEVRVRDADGRFVGPGETAEIVVRGHNVMKGYHNRPAESAHALGNDWLHTGDHARYDDDGYLYLVDRQDRLSQTAAAATAS